MAQPEPIYPEMSVKQHSVVFDEIAKKYPKELCWPLLWYNPTTFDIYSVSFEINNLNNINLRVMHDWNVIQKIDASVCKMDYLKNPHELILLRGDSIPDFIKESVSKEYNKSYDYITGKSAKDNINTIDIDYFWDKDGKSFGLEVSTFYKKMFDKSEAERLISHFVKKRASVSNAHQFHILARASSILHASFSMIFVNTEEKYTTKIVEDGNAFWFPMDEQQAKRIHSGNMPDRTNFGPLNEFFENL